MQVDLSNPNVVMIASGQGVHDGRAAPFGAGVGELTAGQRRLMVSAIVAAHLAAVWALTQMDAVREVVVRAVPLFVSLVTPQGSAAALAHAKPALPAVRPHLPPLPTPEVLTTASPSPAPAAPDVPAQAAAAALPGARPTAGTTPVIAEPAAPAPMPQPRQISASAVQYLEPPVVVYPRLSRRHGEAGRVVVRVYVGPAGGTPRSVQVSQSSGHPRLDEAAVAAVQKARFRPCVENGQPVEGWALIPIDFELEK